MVEMTSLILFESGIESLSFISRISNLDSNIKSPDDVKTFTTVTGNSEEISPVQKGEEIG